jgi:mono/diheme cytochrome c family protein
MNKKVTKIISLMAVVGCVAVGFTSCESKDPNSPGVEFMPDMYRSPSLESNMGYVKIHNGHLSTDTMQANRLPVKGTIPRGFMPYPYANDTAGYSAAGKYLHDPLPKTAANLAEGEVLYGKYCVHCHGKSGQADGPVAAKLSGPPPSYTSPALLALPEGKMFHTITYGKGIMGSHASQVNKEERWKIIMYIQKLQHPDGEVAMAPKADSTAVAAQKPHKGKK